MRVVWLTLVCAFWLEAAPVAAQPQRAQEPPSFSSPRDPGAFARGAAIMGTVSGVLLLGGSVAIAVVDDVESERITRGLWVGTLTLSAPIVALGAWTARDRGQVEGYKQLRWLGWTTWTFALANGVLQWVEAFDGQSQPPGLTIGLGALGALALLPLSLDAFASAHRASMRKRFRISFTPIIRF
jgi:hypothetical protein